MPRCPRLTSGGAFTPAIWERFASWIDGELRARELQPGPGYTFLRSSGGYSLNISGGGGPSAPVKSPWDQIVSSQTSTTITFRFQPGSVGGVMPSNIFTDFTATLTDTKWFWVDATTTAGSVSSCTISSGSTQPAPGTAAADAPPSSFKVLIGVSVNGTYFNVLKKNISAVPVESYRTSRTGAGPFELPYTSYWNWVFA
jgi:hypothetical protein